MTIDNKIILLKKPAILQVLPAMISGGVEREVLDIAEGLVKNGYRSFVASSGGALVSNLTQGGSKHFNLPLKSKNPLIIISNIFKLVKLIKLHNISIIHAQSRAPAWSSYFAAKIAKCHFVTTIHGAHGVSNYFKKIYNSVITKGEKVIAVSNYIADYAKQNYKFDQQKLETIHCGININKFDFNNVEQKRIIELARSLYIPTDKPIITLPGRLSRNKGHLVLLEAIRLLPIDSVTCLFVGSDNGHLKYREELQSKIKEYNLDERVIITSDVKDMPAIYALSDIILCVSTKPEALGLVSLEAQAMGRLVIVNNLGGIRETIIPNETGWFVEPGDVSELANKIMQILSIDFDLRLEHAKKARKYIIKNFSLETMQEKIINVYDQLLKK